MSTRYRLTLWAGHGLNINPKFLYNEHGRLDVESPVRLRAFSFEELAKHVDEVLEACMHSSISTHRQCDVPYGEWDKVITLEAVFYYWSLDDDGKCIENEIEMREWWEIPVVNSWTDHEYSSMEWRLTEDCQQQYYSDWQEAKKAFCEAVSKSGYIRAFEFLEHVKF